MDPVVLLVVFAVTVVAAYFFGRAMAPSGEDSSLSVPTSSSSTPAVTTAAKSPSSNTGEALVALRSQLSDAEKSAKQSDAELRKAREELKEAKQRAHDRGQRLEQVRKELEEDRRKAKAQGSMESTRLEMLNARAEVERLEAELTRVQSTAAPAARKEARKEAPVAPVVVDAAQEESETIRRYESVMEARDAEFRRDFRGQADELRAAFNEQVTGERDRAKTEIRSLQGRLRTALRDVDRERRRTEANDRAYLILKSQLEGTLDRLALHDPSLRRPDALDRPAVVATPADPAAAQAPPVEASTDAPDTTQE